MHARLVLRREGAVVLQAPLVLAEETGTSQLMAKGFDLTGWYVRYMDGTNAWGLLLDAYLEPCAAYDLRITTESAPFAECSWWLFYRGVYPLERSSGSPRLVRRAMLGVRPRS
jgi:hypothetical protein